MVTHAEPIQVGQALAVQGIVRVESAHGVSRIIEPNSRIFLDDQIETGSSGEVLIVLSDDDGTQLDLGRMSQVIIDEDVIGGTLTDLGDVALEAALAEDLLEHWEAFEPVMLIDTVVPEDDSNADDTATVDQLPMLDSAPQTLAADDDGNADLSSSDDDFDIANFIPPPEDAS